MSKLDCELEEKNKYIEELEEKSPKKWKGSSEARICKVENPENNMFWTLPPKLFETKSACSFELNIIS